jgi:hypothetical protein
MVALTLNVAGVLANLPWALDMLDVTSLHVASSVLFLSILLILGLQRKEKLQDVLEKETRRSKIDAVDATPLEETEGVEELPDHPHLQGCFIPNSGEFMHFPNKDAKQYSFENEMCTGSALTVHRATWDPALDRSGDYPFGYVFKDRKINWEVRMQVRLKKKPEGTLHFGIELDEYVPLMGATKALMKVVLAALKVIVGKDLHHSPGDDPAITAGEAERPIFSMPLWALDQFIETPEGEEPPLLTDPKFMEMGIRRADDPREFTRVLDNMEFKVGATYTLTFWSISPLIDNALWKIGGVIPGVTVDFNQFCGKPPVHLVIYTLQRAQDASSDDHRHLDSRKCYLFHIAFWSSLSRPTSRRLRQLLPGRFAAGREGSLDKATSSQTGKGSTTQLGGRARHETNVKKNVWTCFEGLRASSANCFSTK